MKRYLSTIIYSLLAVCLLVSCSGFPKTTEKADRNARLFPDVNQLVVPVNIAPLNFIIREPGEKYCVKFSTADGSFSFVVHSADSVIIIPEKKWRKLLTTAEDNQFTISVAVRENKNWKAFIPSENRVTSDKIDPYITYRRINPGMIFWDNMAIVQRSLENFKESDIISNQNTEKNCMNCHTFHERNPESFLLHLRKAPGGTLVKTENTTRWLNTKTPYTLSGFVYPAWHPNGNFIAFSTNRIHQNFFGTGDRINHVRDDASDIVVYDIASNLVFTDPSLATLDFENIPSWAPDGNYLYFIRSLREFKYLPDSSEKYDLMRVSFSPETKEFGEPETLLSHEETNLSATFPQVSPDGRFLLFCQADYGYFNINNRSSDLYMMDLTDFSYKKLPVNSDVTESWPSWSDNSRWIMFTTKRIDDIITIPHLAHVDPDGNVSRAFPVPFKDPQSYLTRVTNMNRPVFVKGKVPYSQDELEKIVYSQTDDVIFDSVNVDINAISGATVVNETTTGTSVPYMRD